MKKMNFVFQSRILEGVNSRRGLLLFLMLFLFGFGYNSVNAQFVSKDAALAKLTQQIVSIKGNMENLFKSGDMVAVEKAQFKVKVYLEMIQKLKSGSSVKETVEYFTGNNSGTGVVADFQLMPSKTNPGYPWLIEDILKLLKI